MNTLNPILKGIARRLGCGQTWNEVVIAIDALIKQRDDLKIDAERFRTSFYKLRRKTEDASRQLKDEELSEAVENSGGFGVVGKLEIDSDDIDRVLDTYEAKLEFPPLTSPVERMVKEFVGSRECPDCSRVIGAGACPSCNPIEFVSEVAGEATLYNRILSDDEISKLSEGGEIEGGQKLTFRTVKEAPPVRTVRRFWSGNAWVEE